MKKIIYIFMAFVISFMMVDSVNAETTANGVSITGTSDDNTFELYCEYSDGTSIHFVTYASDDTIQPDVLSTDGEELYCESCQDYTESKMISQGFMTSDKSGECPLYVYGDYDNTNGRLSNIQGFSNSSSNGSYTSISLNTVESYCDGDCSTADQQNTTELNAFNCYYIGQEGGGNLSITSDGSNVLNVTYPDGSTGTINNGIIDDSCTDIYYVASKKLIKAAVSSNLSNSQTLASLCNDYSDDEIEHYCEEGCSYSEYSCPTDIDTDNCGILGTGLVSVINKIYGFIKILIPVLIIALSLLDFAKTVGTGKDDDFKKAQSNLVKRLVVGIIFFLVPILVSLLINFSGITDQYDFGSGTTEAIFCILG